MAGLGRKAGISPLLHFVEEALFDLEVLDFRSFVLTDESDGKPSDVYEQDGGVVLQRIDGSRRRRIRFARGSRSTRRRHRTPAAERLDLSGEPFIFFDPSDRGGPRAIYRRYDGHYGLIEPVGCTQSNRVGTVLGGHPSGDHRPLLFGVVFDL